MSKNKQKVIEDWIHKHGAASFDLKKRDIILHDGGLFAIESKKVRRHKIIGRAMASNGCVQILFSKNKPVRDVEYSAVFWIEELHETVLYLQSMEKMLKSLGYKTDLSYGKKTTRSNPSG